MDNGSGREARLSLPPDARLPDFDGIFETVTAHRLPDVELSAVYMDTAELRLARSDITLRRRTESSEGGSRQVWILELPAAPGGYALSRTELSWRARGEDPPKGALRLVRAPTFGLPLEPVARVETKRRRVGLRDLEDTDLAKVVDDEVIVVDGDRPGRCREIDVELSPDAPDGLMEAVVDHLVAAGAGSAGGEPKLVRALGPLCREPPDTRPPGLDARSTVRQLAADTIGRALSALVTHDAGLRLGGHVEHVHKARVATRRLRSNLRMLRPLLDRAWADGMRKELRWIAAALGDVRDADVLFEQLTAAAAALPEDDAAASKGLLHRIAEQRDEANRRLLRRLNGKPYLRLLKDLRAAMADPPLNPKFAGDERALDVLPRLVRRTWRRVRRTAPRAGADVPDAVLHELRKRAKALRYAAESAAPVAGKPAARLARRAEKLQDVLGGLQDTVVAEAWLREYGPLGPPAEALVAGELIAAGRIPRLEARALWPKAWKKLRRKKTRAWLRG